MAICRAVDNYPYPAYNQSKAAAYWTYHERVLRATGADSNKQDLVSLRVYNRFLAGFQVTIK